MSRCSLFPLSPTSLLTLSNVLQVILEGHIISCDGSVQVELVYSAVYSFEGSACSCA